MAEVPDYLLQRSRERRAALGLAPFGAPEGSAPETAPEGAGGAPPGGEVAPAGGGVPAPAAASAPATAAPAALAPVSAPEVAPYLAPPAARTGIPAWVLPVLAILPVWAFAYVGALSPPSVSAPVLTPLQQGAQVYAKNCSPCHGTKGEGGVGPQLAGGQAKLTFPNEADQIAWVDTGSGPHKGQPYGDPARAGGQHVAKSGGMPPFKGTLTDAEIKNVVTFERDGLK
jgi:mono/diheme cytochrome c family protein